MKIESGYAQVNGTRLYYEVAGSGHPLVLIHGMSLDTRMWDDQFDNFAQYYRVIRYDVRGFGQSAVPGAERYTHTGDLNSLLEHLAVPLAHILGLSMGGRIAIDFALMHPDRVSTLIPIDCTPGGWQYSPDLATSTNAVFVKARESSVQDALNLWIDLPIFSPAMENVNVSSRLLKIIASYSGWRWVNDDPIRHLDPPAINQLETIKATTLSMVGEYDIPDMHEGSDLLIQRIPNSRKVVIQGVGHMSNMEAPEAFNEAILSFLSGLDG